MAGPKIDIQSLGEVTVVSFPETTLLDTLAAELFGREINKVLDTGVKSGLVIDFENVRFLSSPTLGVLVSLSRRAKRGGARVVLASVPREFAAVFKVTDLLKFFELYENRADALAGFTRSSGA